MDYSNLSKKDIIKGIKNNSIFLNKLSEEFKDDREIVLEAIKKDGGVLYFASKRLQDDKDVVLEAVKNNSWSLQYASEKLQNNKQLLEIFGEIKFKTHWPPHYKKWYEERMDVLANIKEKELMEKNIYLNNKTSKKIKF